MRAIFATSSLTHLEIAWPTGGYRPACGSRTMRMSDRIENVDCKRCLKWAWKRQPQTPIGGNDG